MIDPELDSALRRLSQNARRVQRNSRIICVSWGVAAVVLVVVAAVTGGSWVSVASFCTGTFALWALLSWSIWSGREVQEIDAHGERVRDVWSKETW